MQLVDWSSAFVSLAIEALTPGFSGADVVGPLLGYQSHAERMRGCVTLNAWDPVCAPSAAPICETRQDRAKQDESNLHNKQD